ncbi:MAG: FecR domain-containing protein, partial [Magnetovibrio sp.]|nr:FecR domain-containing protein [Magnetovibrio sp.]
MKGLSAQTPAHQGAQTYAPISWSGAHETFQGNALSLPQGEDFLRAEFLRSGTDLLIETPSGGHFVVVNYFTFQSPPALETADGAILNAQLVTQLAGSAAAGMSAQVGQRPLAEILGEPIGQVNESEGLVTVTRADGEQVNLSLGDNIYQGDVIETGPKGNTSIVFADDTIFTLNSEGRMVMDEMVYDPGSQTGVFSAHVVQGLFSFVSGKIAKTSPDGMVLSTPTNTIGIRGSTVLGEAAQEGSSNTITLINDVNGNVGELVISNGAGTIVLNQAGATTTVFSAFSPPTPFVIMSPQDIQQNYGSTLTALVRTVAKKADADTKESARKAQKAEFEAEQAQTDAKQAEAQAAEAEAQAADAEAQAVQAQLDAEAAQVEAEAL